MAYSTIKNGNLDTILFFIIGVKILWIVSIFSGIFINKYHPQYRILNENIEDILHNTFTIAIGILLIYLYNYFNKSNSVCIEGDTKLYLFSFGIISVIGIIQKFYHKIYYDEYKGIEQYLMSYTI
jgi:hypothetical protein